MDPRSSFQLAVAHYRQGQFELAETQCRAALKREPKNVAGLHLLAMIQFRKGEADDAVVTFDRLLRLQPASPDLLNNRGVALQQGQRFEEALASFDGAVRLKPDYAEALNNRSTALKDLGRFAEALEHPFNFAWYSRSAAAEARCTEIFAAREWPRPRKVFPPPRRYKHERIRLAYFSPDYREHPISYVFAGLVERHDRQRFEVSALSYGPSDGSAMRARLERIFDRFTDVRADADLKVARLIPGQEIDIAVDLSGFTASNRGAVLAYRPAPLVVNFQGFRTAAPLIDYVIA